MERTSKPRDAAQDAVKNDPAGIEWALRLILQPGQVTELRVLDAVTATDRRPHTFGGYFDDPVKLATATAAIVSAKGIYFVPNPITPALLARSLNQPGLPSRPTAWPTPHTTQVFRDGPV